MQVLHEKIDEHHIFYIEINNERLAKMFFHMSNDDRMVIEHTEVSEQLKGKGIGKELVDHAVEYARKNNFKIIPLCPFTKSVFERFSGYEDVWVKE
jgi:hypothetical protein